MLDQELEATLREVLETLPLVPDIYAEYRPLVVDGFVQFLGRLSNERIEAIVSEQLMLPEETSVDERLVAMLHQCPTLHKLGQVVSHDKRLAPALRERLQSLESLAPTTELSSIEAVLARELNGIPAGIELAPRALAEGSVAVVLPFGWNEPGERLPRRGVFKILKPLAEQQMREELGLFPAMGEYLEERCKHYGLPALDYRNTLDSVRSLLLNEIRLDLEQSHLAKAERFYAGEHEVHVPRLLPFCTPHVTAMERIDGVKVTNPRLEAERRRKLAATIIESLLAKPFWSAEPLAVFHADPHAGNLFASEDGRLAILDWALIVELTREQRAAVMQAALGALTLDEQQTIRAIASLGKVLERRKLEDAVADAFRLVRRGVFPGFDWLTGLLDGVMAAGAMQFPEELTLFRKALLTLSGVVSDVSGRPSLDQVLTKTGAAQFFRELAGRPLARIDSRDFGSHLSNEDLICTWAALFFVPSRYWIASWRDVLSTLAKAGT
jgi:ubiquinone biosynthesis protein